MQKKVDSNKQETSSDFNVIAGLPRAGSTLLCNVLSQNPDFHASSTSIVPALFASITQVISTSPEYKGELHSCRDQTEKKTANIFKSVVSSWYPENKTIFDKNRAWGHHALLLKKLFPESKIILCVRDLRTVFASIEKQHRKTAELDNVDSLNGKTLYARADQMFSPNGLIGHSIVGIEDVLHRKLDDMLIVVQYENFVKNPDIVMSRIYDALGKSYFSHDFTNIKNTATDLDVVYNYKFPHEGSGALYEPDPEEWKAYMSNDIAQLIMQRFSHYNGVFGYK